jgi:hypothetical protein
MVLKMSEKKNKRPQNCQVIAGFFMKTIDSLRFFGEITDFYSDFSQRTTIDGSLSVK